jgi:DNA-binding transcriptional MerR regulator
MTNALTRPLRLDLTLYARLTGVHPELVRRLVRLGLLDVTQDSKGGLWFDPSQVAAMARIQRLRSGLGLNYASLGLVLELLDRITDLENTQTRVRTRFGGPSWT